MSSHEMMSQKRLSKEECGYIEEEDGTIRIEDMIIPPARAPALSNDTPDSRLIIIELIIENFKSYAGKQTLGPFNNHFTSIVGPNGSGKSNVIDALLFVFGYKSKKIRSKKLSLLIHKSMKHPNLTRCTVTVNFATISERDGSYCILPDSRFVLSRTVNSDDTSHYEMMNKRVLYKDVTRTLKAYGIDLEHSRFLILQGEIEAISLMTAKAQTEHDTGMLEYLEDIIGSNRLIEPIKTFRQRVEKLNEEKKLQDNELGIIASEKDKLEEPKNQAVQYLRLKNKSLLLENSIFQLQRLEAENELQKAIDKKKEFMTLMRDVKKKMDELKDAKKLADYELEKVNSEFDKVIKLYEEYKEEFKKLERVDVSLAENIKHSKTKKDTLQNSLTKQQNDLNKLLKQTEVYEKETLELTAMKKKVEAEKEIEDTKTTEVMGSLQEETNAIQSKKDKLEKELIKSKDTVNELRSEMDLLHSELGIFMSGDKKEKEKLATLVSDLDKNTAAAQSEAKLLIHDDEYISRLENELESLNKEFQVSKMQEADLTQEIKLKRMKLEEAKNSMYSTKSRSQMINAFMKEKAQGRLTGVYGRLGDLGAIDPKYDVAISTACGPLDNIVTDTLATAQQCVDYLKKHNLGYTTFIPLDKMAKWIPYTKQRISTPENVPRLFDLITVNNEAILPAFYYAIKDTLVANDLDQATRIGLQGKSRYRVVTLKGELIDLAGTMSGGGGRMLRGRMGSKIVESTTSTEDVSRMNAEIDKLTANLANIKKKILKLETQISEKRTELISAQRSTKKRKVHHTAYQESIQTLKQQVEEQKKKMQTIVIDQNKIKKLEEDIKEKRKVYVKATEESSAIEKRVSELQSEILKISKGKFSKAQKNMDRLEKQIQELTQSITKSTVNMKTSKRNIKKLENSMSSNEKEIEILSSKLLSLKKERSDLEEKAREVKQQEADAEKKIGTLKENKGHLKRELGLISEKEHQLKLEDGERRNQLKKLEENESDLRSSIKGINAALSKLKLNEVEDDPTEIPTLTNEEIFKLKLNQLKADLEETKLRMDEITPNISSIKAFKIKEQQYLEKKKEVDRVNKEKLIEVSRCDELQKRRLKDFMTGFAIIAKKLKEIYQMLTLGGDAEIQPVDNSDPFAHGIEFSVRPPKKSWKIMKFLSGGEKTLSSLALVFALHYYRPTPFYVMDEVDAALDFRNVAIIAFYLKDQTPNAQLIVVSLRNIMNELSDQLLGIYKINDCTKILNLANAASWSEDNDEPEAAAAASA